MYRLEDYWHEAEIIRPDGSVVSTFSGFSLEMLLEEIRDISHQYDDDNDPEMLQRVSDLLAKYDA